MVNCLIIDDEPLAIQVIENYLAKVDGFLVVKKCLNALEAFNAIHQASIDLVFLDINMPGISGIDFIRSLKEPPAVIFTTAYSEFALISYDLAAVDYLLKPITFERFQSAIARYQRINESKEVFPEYTYFKVDGKMIRLFHENIRYVQSVKDYLMIYTDDGKYMTHMTMKYLCDLLPAKVFSRVHRSFLVNMNRLNVIGRNEVEIEGSKIPIGEQYKYELKTRQKGGNPG